MFLVHCQKYSFLRNVYKETDVLSNIMIDFLPQNKSKQENKDLVDEKTCFLAQIMLN
jgi:hypothetical protein